ncbi:unnamed protein product [Bemisia tabaci]|uniref:Uncharacterized protein n=1 Tax=Bemisia tabaci TaxID=7038 RepID=A0A9P0A4X7_BEMTA|nr:unnamed protein product [Bemisia tabaci]
MPKKVSRWANRGNLFTKQHLTGSLFKAGVRLIATSARESVQVAEIRASMASINGLNGVTRSTLCSSVITPANPLPPYYAISIPPISHSRSPRGSGRGGLIHHSKRELRKENDDVENMIMEVEMGRTVKMPQRSKYRRVNERLHRLAGRYEAMKTAGRQLDYLRACAHNFDL